MGEGNTVLEHVVRQDQRPPRTCVHGPRALLPVYLVPLTIVNS